MIIMFIIHIVILILINLQILITITIIIVIMIIIKQITGGRDSDAAPRSPRDFSMRVLSERGWAGGQNV